VLICYLIQGSNCNILLQDLLLDTGFKSQRHWLLALLPHFRAGRPLSISETMFTDFIQAGDLQQRADVQLAKVKSDAPGGNTSCCSTDEEDSDEMSDGTCRCMFIRTDTCMRPHNCALTYTHTQTHICTHTHTQTHTYAHIHTHTHTYAHTYTITHC
jgi:hypothetical protein